MINEEEKTIKEKLEFYKNKDMRVHIKLKNKRFLNGKVIGKEEEKVYSFTDDKLGIIHIFITDIYEIEQYQQEVKG